MATASVVLESDTVIIDGEYIYIEKEDVITNVDSLEEAARDDVKKEKVKRERGNLNLLAGPNTTFGSYATSTLDQRPLDVFMGNNRSMATNVMLGLDVGFHLFSWKVPNGEKRISAHVGIGYNQMKFRSTQFIDETQLAQDSILDFYRNGDKLIMEYFVNTDPNNPIIGEADTVQIALEENLTRITSWDIPLRLRWTQNVGNTNWSWLAETGLVYSLLKKTNDVQNQYVLGKDAQFSKLDKEDFKVSNKLNATLGLGMKYYFNGRFSSSAKWRERFTGGFVFQCTLPPSRINQSELFYFDAWSAGLNFMVGLYF